MTDLAPSPNTTGPAAELIHNPTGPLSPDQAREAQRLYQEISQALIDPAEDLQTIRTKAGPRTFPKRSALQKLANAYRVSTEILSRELTHDTDGQLVRCDAVVRATHPDGRHADGDGACAISEERFARGSADKVDHDLPATAVTRATNRAISNLIAFGAVSAEEAEGAPEATATAVTVEPPEWATHTSPDDIPVIRGNLERILAPTGHPSHAAEEVGSAIWTASDSGFPRIVADTLALIAQMLATPPAGGPWAPGSGIQENQS